MRRLLWGVMLMSSLSASAGWDEHVPFPSLAAFDAGKSAPNGFVRNKVRVGDEQATAKVRKRYPKSRILSVNLIESKGPPVYRVKTLSAEGVVKYVFVDSRSGDVFE